MRVIAIVKHCMILVALSIYIQAASQAMCDQPLEEANQTMLYMMDVCRDQLLQRALESGTASDLAIALSQVRRDEPMRVLLIASLQMVARQGCWLKMYVLLEDLKPFWMQIKSTLGHAFILASKKNHMEMARNLHLRCRDLGMRRHLSFGVAAAARNKHWDLSFYLCFGSIHFGATYQNDALAHLLEAAFDYNASEVIRRFDTQIVYCSQCVIPNIPDFVKNKSRDEVIHFLIVTYEEESFSYDKWSLRILLQSIIKHRHCNLLKRLVADDFSLHNGCKDQLRLEIVKAALLVGCSELALQVFPLIPKDIEMIGEVTDLAAACRDEEFLFKLKSLCSCGDFQSQCNSLLMDSFSLTGNPLHQLLWWQMADEQSTVNSTSLFEVVDFTQSMDCVLAHEDSSHDIAFPSQQDESEHLMKQSADHHHGQRFWWARSFSTVLKLHHWDSTLDLLRHATPRSFQRVFPKYVATLFQLGNVEIMFHVLCLLVIKADALEIFKKSAQHLLVRNDYDSMKQLLLLTPWSKMKALHVQIISNYMLNDHWYQSVFDSLSSGNLVDMYDLALQTIAAYGTRPKDLLFQVIVLQIALMRPERMHLIHARFSHWESTPIAIFNINEHYDGKELLMVDVSTPTRRRKAASAASATSNEESVGGSTPRKRIVKENTNSSSATISNLMPSICLFVMGILGIAVSLLVFLYYPILLEHSKQLQSMVFTKIFESKKPTVSRNAPADEPAAQRPIAHSLNIAGYCLRKDTSKSKHMCGEDAFLISESTGNKEGSGRSFFAVADGVGGWSESGGDSSKVSVGILDAIKAQLDETMEEEAEEFSRLIVQVGSKAFDQLKQAQLKRGSTTVCAALFDHVSGVLEVANVGDSGAFVIRNGRVISRTRAGLDGFNTPHQLGFDDAGNAYGSFERMHTLVKETLRKGDVVVVVSDGVIDNLFEFEIEQAVQLLVGSLINEEDGSGAGKRISHLVTDRHLAMQERLTSASMTLALMAYARGKESLWVSPFAETAMAHGYSYAGGKQDDISVIIAVAK